MTAEHTPSGEQLPGDRKIDDMLTQMIAETAMELTTGSLPLLDPIDVMDLFAERESIVYRRHQEAIDAGEYRNPNVPWDDGQIPYHCECGRITYSDSPCDCPNSHYGPYAD